MRRTLFIAGLAAALGLSAAARPAAAQDSRYGQWTSPDSQPAGDARLQELLDRLNKLVDQAEKARAADPVFLKDLRDLAKSYAGPAAQGSRTVLSDDFGDGDFTANPAWTVTAGTYFIEKGWGLRNKVEQAAAEGEQRKLTREEKALQIFGAILQGANRTGGTASAPSTGTQETAIHTAAAVPNAFDLEMEVSSWLAQGRLAVAVYQGGDRLAGYRLVYDVGRGFSMQRYSARGASTIYTGRDVIALEDKKVHRLNWTRGTDGRMVVSLDGRPVIDTLDRGFRDPFSGVELRTAGGDFIVKRVTVTGTP